ncbi:putative phospholipid hydroperoxide glutathione peroxidase [Glycine soja]
MFIELSIFNEISACIHTFTSLLFIIENLRPICLKQRNNYSISFIFLSCLGIHSSSIFFLFKFLLLLLLFCRQAGPFGLLGIKPCVGCNRISSNWKRQSSITGTRPRQVSQYAEKGRYLSPMLSTSATRIFFLRSTTIRLSSSSSSSSLQFFSNPNRTLFRPFLHTSFKPLPSSFSFRTDHTMATSNAKSVHDFTVKDAKGNDINLGDYKGKVLIIVNVASQCGLTNSNYTELSQLYEKYKQKGLEILAFPCNQFGAQEPGSNEQIQEFVCTRFKAEFPVFDKVDVNGDKAAPLYKYLKSSKGGLLGDGIKWNFAKFLVDKEGNVVDRYAPTTSPLSIEKDLLKLLDA